jgi:hypothetical protein
MLPSWYRVCTIFLHFRAPLFLLLHGNVRPFLPPLLLGVLTDTELSDRRLNSRDHLRDAFHADIAFATLSVSLTAPDRRPRVSNTSNVGGGPNRTLSKMATLRFTEDGRLSGGSLDLATIGHEDEQLPSNPLLMGDHGVAPIPPSYNPSSSLPASHV